MNNGEHLWQIPIGETPERVSNHPELKEMDLPITGTGRNAQMGVTKSILMYTGNASDGTPMLYFVDKISGEQLGGVEVENQTNYGLMTYMHHEKQYIVLQTGPKLTALALYEDEAETNEH